MQSWTAARRRPRRRRLEHCLSIYQLGMLVADVIATPMLSAERQSIRDVAMYEEHLRAPKRLIWSALH